MMKSQIPENRFYDAIIVGAGISALVLANGLKHQSLRVLVLEKSKSVGGRIATRRDGEAAYDHGAQFFKRHVSEAMPEFNSQGLAKVWFSQGEMQFFAAAKGLTQVTKAFAQGLDITFNERAVDLTKEVMGPQTMWKVRCDSGAEFFAANVFLSSPLPQSLEILKASGILYPEDLNQISYAKALVGLFELKEDLPQFNYLAEASESLFSISNQLSKQVSAKPALTVTMQPQWSDKYFAEEESKALGMIESECRAFFKEKSVELTVVKGQLKKWRYSHPLSKYSKDFLQLPGEPQVYLLGDAFGGGSIRGAAQSAQSLLDFLAKSSLSCEPL